jgi:hypothetical protein
MVQVSMSLILPCWSGCTVVSFVVKVLICAWSWSLICLLPGTPISIVPSLTTTITRSHNTRILCIPVSFWWWLCRVRGLKVGALNLSLGSLKSLTHSLHSGLSDLLIWAKIWSLQGRTNMDPHVAPLRSSALHLPFSFHDSSLVFKDYSLVHHVLKIDKITGLESISETIVQSIEKPVLLLLICIHVIKSITG